MIIDIYLFNNTSNGSGKKILCQCDKCWKTKHVSKYTFRLLKNNTYTFCNKCTSNNGKTIRIKDIIGKKFSRLSVLERIENKISKNKKRSYVQYKCMCDCGKITFVCYPNLTKKSGATLSCGCYRIGGVKEHTALKKTYGFSRRNAITRNLSFNISLGHFEKITQENCYYCNIPPSNTTTINNGKRRYVYNGLDRKDNSVGYEINNIVSCCKKCNRAKSVMGENEFIEWIEKVYEYAIIERNIDKLITKSFAF